MSPRKTDEHGQRPPRARAKRRTPPRVARVAQRYQPIADPGPNAHEQLEPHELYRLEKARREGGDIGVNEILAEARREYLALLAADATKGKGGRPRKTATKSPTTSDQQGVISEEDDTDEG
jgi:hypothetical protein